MNASEKLSLAEAEIARLENIIAIKQKQIERLLDQRDILEAQIKCRALDELDAKMQSDFAEVFRRRL